MTLYKFSLPMPSKTNHIDDLLSFNKKIKKSQITNLYFGLPVNCNAFTGFESARFIYKEDTDIEYWIDLIKYSTKNGFDFIYLLNSPRPLEPNQEFVEKLKKVDYLLSRLQEAGCNKLRVSNPRMIQYLTQHHKDFEIYASTSFEYKTLKEYENFFKLYPMVKQIVPSHDVSKNFLLLKNLKKLVPNVEIELIINENCQGGCPNRFWHACSECLKNDVINHPVFKYGYYKEQCTRRFEEDPLLYLCKSNTIYPWEIEEYGKIGITNFKLLGRDATVNYPTGEFVSKNELYMLGIEDYKNIKDNFISNLVERFYYSEKLHIRVDNIRKLLPKIDYFKKNGHLCASKCGIDCKYCYECAENIKRKIYS